MTRHGITELSADMDLQRAFIGERVPVYARLLDLLKVELDTGTLRAQLEAVWATRQFDSVYERPLLLLGALRFDALCEGAGHPLHAAIASEPPAVEAVTLDGLRAALSTDRIRLWHALERRLIQTNESSRAVSWLWPAHLMHLAAGWERMALVDLGTSAGLNLVADALPAPWTRTDNLPLSLTPKPEIVRRIGLDRAPLDATDSLSAQWLRACVWPGETLRQTRLERGLAAFAALAASGAAPELIATDLGNAIATLRALPADVPVLAVQTIVRDYLPDALKATHRANMHTFLGERAPASALWVELEMEPGGTSTDTAAAITAHVRAASDGKLHSIQLARCYPHPNVLGVDDAAVQALRAAVSADRIT